MNSNMYIKYLNKWQNINMDCLWWINMIDFSFYILSYMFQIIFNQKIRNAYTYKIAASKKSGKSF